MSYKCSVLFSFFLVLVSGCDDKFNESSEIPSIYSDAFTGLLCPIHFEEAKFYEPNFPFWFNDSLIQKHGISKISIEKRQVFPDSTTFLKDGFGFYFNEAGQVHKLHHSIFYDDKAISEEEFLLTEINPFYFQVVSNIKDDLNYQLFEMKTDSDSLLVLQQINGDSRRVFVQNQEDQYVHFIDKLSGNQGNTFWFYGNPRFYTEKFILENMVNKPEQVNLEFLNDHRLITQTIRSKGFVTKRTYNYDQTNHWTGYQDSVFSLTGNFIKLQEMKISLSELAIPEIFVISNGLEASKLTTILTLDFNYEFFE